MSGEQLLLKELGASNPKEASATVLEAQGLTRPPTSTAEPLAPRVHLAQDRILAPASAPNLVLTQDMRSLLVCVGVIIAVTWSWRYLTKMGQRR